MKKHLLSLFVCLFAITSAYSNPDDDQQSSRTKRQRNTTCTPERASRVRHCPHAPKKRSYILDNEEEEEVVVETYIVNLQQHVMDSVDSFFEIAWTLKDKTNHLTKQRLLDSFQRTITKAKIEGAKLDGFTMWLEAFLQTDTVQNLLELLDPSK